MSLSKVTINEIDNTLYSSGVATSDNIAFIPGITSDGAENVCQLFNTAGEFINAMGNRPDGADSNYMTAWDYAYNLLDQGMPVLFCRIVPSIEDINALKTANPLSTSSPATTAGVALNGPNSEGTAEDFGMIGYKYVGTNGNNFGYMFTESSSAIYLKVYKKVKTELSCIESLKVCDIPSDVSKKYEAFTNGLIKIKSSYVVVDLDDPTAIHYYSAMTTPVMFTDGTDPDIESVSYVLARDWQLNGIHDVLIDKFLTDVKFITSGVCSDTFITNDYTETTTGGDTIVHTPADNEFPIAANMINVAETRKDCIAIPDMPIGVPLEDIKYFLVPGYEEGAANTGFNSSYASTFAPWTLETVSNGQMWCPPSFAFLYRLAKSLKAGNSIWEVPAGITRATLANVVDAEYDIGQVIIDNWQNNNRQFINPIAKIKQYGYVIWGNKTLYNPPLDDDGNVVTSALSDISVRIVANEIKRTIFKACLELTFEKNVLRTWNEFRGKITPTLASMKEAGAVYGYQVILGTSTISDEDIAQNRIKGVVRVSIARTAENFDIDFILEPAGATFENEEV